MLTKRTNILFDNDLWEKLTRLASSKKTSVGNLVRTAAEEKYRQEDSSEQARQALQAIESTRPHFKGKLDYKLSLQPNTP